MRSGGFFAGAVAGLAIALLVVGAASFLPQTSNPLKAASPQATTSVATRALATSSTTNGSGQFAAVQPGGQIAGLPISAPASSSTTTAPVAGVGAASALSGGGNQVQSGAGAAGGTQKPSSLLAVLPGESAGRVIATVSPLLVGLLVAALVYGAYARRQDSSS